MKILLTITFLEYSGAPKMIAWIANQMAERGHDVHLVTYFSEEQARLLHERVTMHSLKIVRSKNYLVRNTTGMLKAIHRLHKIIKQIKPDVMLSFLDSVGYIYLLIGRLFTRRKFVISERSDPYAWRGRTASVRKILMHFAHGIVFQTKGAQQFFEKYNRICKQSTVIPNPVVVNEEIISMQQNIPSACERDKRIVTVGRLSLRQKRQDVLLDAFKIFHAKHPDYQLVMYGDGPDTKNIQALIDKMGLSESVTLAGRTDCVEKDIFHAGAFVLSSDYEGIPNALIEAMSIGVPSVSTDCSPGGAALLIKDGENGFLVPRGDAAAIAEKLSLIVSNSDIAQTFSKNSPLITNEFSETIIADKWEVFLKKIAGGRK